MSTQKSILDALKMLILSETIGTQDEFILALKQQGFDINQSKMSRLLRKLGAVKITNEHKQIVYALPFDPPPPTSKNILSQLIISITTNESLIIIHTHPGSASLISRLLDYNREELQIAGTVAGDDTIFIAPLSVKGVHTTLNLIKNFLRDIN